MFTEKDIGMRVTYKDGLGNNETGKLKSYNNETRTAFVVYKCNGNRDLDHRKGYTAQATSYDDIYIKQPCKYCNGQGRGVETEAGHGCDGTDENCSMVCPVPIPVQVPCPECCGEGFIDIYIGKEKK